MDHLFLLLHTVKEISVNAIGFGYCMDVCSIQSIEYEQPIDELDDYIQF